VYEINISWNGGRIIEVYGFYIVIMSELAMFKFVISNEKLFKFVTDKVLV